MDEQGERRTSGVSPRTPDFGPRASVPSACTRVLKPRSGVRGLTPPLGY